MELSIEKIEQRTSVLKQRVIRHNGSKSMASAAENKDALWDIVIPTLLLVSKLWFVPKKIKNAIKAIIEVYGSITN